MFLHLNDPQASQRLDGWRGNFASIAMDEVRALLNNGKYMNRDARAAHVAEALDPSAYCYLFATVEKRNPPLPPVRILQFETFLYYLH
jgi:hypothetical protein